MSTQPATVEVTPLQHRQQRLRRIQWSAVARDDIMEILATVADLGSLQLGQPAESGDGPIVRGRNDRGLQQNHDRGAAHVILRKAWSCVVEPDRLDARLPIRWP
jgi:hypothetical protein